MTIEETAIRPRLAGKLSECNVLVHIDDRVRSKGFPSVAAEEMPKSVHVEHSKTYSSLHERIQSALRLGLKAYSNSQTEIISLFDLKLLFNYKRFNQEENFQMKPPERSEERTPVVYLSETADWSTFTSTYKGEPHRNTLGKVFE